MSPRALCLAMSLTAGLVCPAAENRAAVRWRVLTHADEAPAGWTAPGFDDSGWAVGGEVLGGLPAGPVLLRERLAVPDPARVTGLTLEVAGDGPWRALLNGVEVFRSPRPLPYRVEPTTGEVVGFTVDLSGIAHELRPGENVLAVEVEGPVSLPRLRLTTGPAPRSEERAPAQHPGPPETLVPPPGPRFVILLVCDGWGPLQLQAANLYTGTRPSYQADTRWSALWMSTFPFGGGYDGTLAWSSFTYPLSGATDSAAGATAMFTGAKTSNGRISVDAGGLYRLESLGERARVLGLAVGAVTTVPVSHATPGAFTSHNLSRVNTFAIADEAFFGDPNTTGTTALDPKYGGGFGPTLPPSQVVIGDRASGYVHPLQRDKLFLESGLPGRHRLVEGEPGVSGAAALLDAAADPDTTLLAGLFDRADLRVTAPGGGYRLETPSLAASTAAALTVLERSAAGFVLTVEGGAVDWAAHANDMDWTLGELLDFNAAVTAVLSWVDDPGNPSSWGNTLVVVTGDHETGYLTAAPGVFPDRPLAPGSVTDATLALEKVDLNTGRRASWVDDSPPNDRIDPGETVFWAWNAGGHSNILIPVFARGPGSERLDQLAVHLDPLRGAYVDNTGVLEAAVAALDTSAIFADGFESGDPSRWSGSVP